MTAAALTLLASNVAAATGGRILAGNPDAPVGRVMIDSRAVGPGDCFVAIRGERLDGHAFVKDAVAAGAASIVVEAAAAVEGAAAIVTGPEEWRLREGTAKVAELSSPGARRRSRPAGAATSRPLG